MTTSCLARRAVALCGAALVLGLAACGPADRPSSVRAAQDADAAPTTVPAADPAMVAEVDAAMAATARACAQPEGATPEGATEARDVVPGKIAVVGSDGTTCLLGVADLIVVSDTEPIPDYVPVYDIEDQDRVIGYWSDGYGWVTPEQRNDPAFDLEAHRAAYAQIMATGPGPQN